MKNLLTQRSIILVIEIGVKANFLSLPPESNDLPLTFLKSSTKTIRKVKFCTMNCQNFEGPNRYNM